MAPTPPIAAITVQAKGSLDPFRFNMLMRDLLSEHGRDITWMSGVLIIQDSEESKTQFRFEGAHQTVTFGRCSAQLEESQFSSSQLTFMGLRIPEQDLQEAFNTCTWEPVAAGWTQYHAQGWPYYVHQATGYKQWHRPAATDVPAISFALNHTQAAHQSDSGAADLEAELPAVKQRKAECLLRCQHVSPSYPLPSRPYTTPNHLSPKKQQSLESCTLSPLQLQQDTPAQTASPVRRADGALAASGQQAVVESRHISQGRATWSRPSSTDTSVSVTEQSKMSAAELRIKQERACCNIRWRPESGM
ncbi:MAG: hypothetical protein FRX49_03343 [Trebouxia sp. A1-2]|nr:MAG: hypothetical protein FRX49_03343 [Trebouxia sp. A1-2]